MGDKMKMLQALLTLGLLCAFSTVLAQTEVSQGLLTCSAIEAAEGRLACYDDLANDATAPVVSSADHWYVSNDTNPVDDSTTVFFATEATEGSTTPTYGDSYILKLRCQSGELAAWVSWNEYLGLDTTEVTYRVGTAGAVTDTWYISTDNQSTFFSRNQSPTRAFIEKLAASDNRKLITQVTPYGENTATGVFNVSGLSDMLPQLYEHCPA